jgi:hypothetical protein
VLELVPSGDGARHVGTGRRFRGQDLDAGNKPSLAACLDIRGVDDEAIQPGFEPLRVSEGWQVTPRAKQCLLGRILGTVRIAQDPVGEGVAAVDM